MQLPAELRNEIYKHIIGSSVVKNSVLRSAYRIKPSNYPIFQVSRQVRREALAVYFENITLRHSLLCHSHPLSSLGEFGERHVRTAELRWACSCNRWPVGQFHDGIEYCVEACGKVARGMVASLIGLKSLYVRLELDTSFIAWYHDGEAFDRLNSSGLLDLRIGGQLVVHLVLNREAMRFLPWKLSLIDDDECSKTLPTALKYIVKTFIDALPSDARVMLSGLPLVNKRIVPRDLLGQGNEAWMSFLRRIYMEDSINLAITAN